MMTFRRLRDCIGLKLIGVGDSGCDRMQLLTFDGAVFSSVQAYGGKDPYVQSDEDAPHILELPRGQAFALGVATEEEVSLEMAKRNAEWEEGAARWERETYARLKAKFEGK